MDVGKIRANGPWVFIKADPPDDKYEGSGLYKAAGNMEDRMGISTGTVLSVGQGKWSDKGQCYLPAGVEKGERVAFRGFLQEANRPGLLDKEHCFLHQDDILGTVDKCGHNVSLDSNPPICGECGEIDPWGKVERRA